MNTNNDNLEQLLVDELHDAAGDMGGARLQLTDVRGRARSIRRTRIAVGTVGAAVAVAAAVIPLALVVGMDRSADQLPPSTSPTVTESAEQTDPHPSLAFAQGSEIHPVDGEPFTPELDTSSGMQFVRFGENWVVASYDDVAMRVSVVDGTGRVLKSYDAVENPMVANAAGTAVAWLGRDGAARVLAVGADEPAVLAAELPGRLELNTLLALRGDCTGSDCELLFDSYTDQGSETYRMGLDGQPERILEGALMSLSDISPDGTLATGMISADDMNQTSCSAVVEIATGEQVWKTCDASSLRFSPDGAHVLGVDPYLDGPNHGMWVVLDATDGSEVAGGEGIIYNEAWDTDTSWLVVAGEGDGGNGGNGQVQVLRYSLDSQNPTVVAEGPDRQLDEGGYHLEPR